MPLASLNHHVKPRPWSGSVQHSFCTAKAISRAVRSPCLTKTRLGRGIALPCVCGSKQESRDTEGPSSRSPASTFISYAKLLTLTGFIAASMLLEKRPAHARTSLPETVHTMSQASSTGSKRGLWSKLKATATAPVGMLDHLLFPDEPLAFIRSSADEDHQSTPPHQQDPSTAQDGVAPAATTKLPSALPDTATTAPAAASTPDTTPAAADVSDDDATLDPAAEQARQPALPSTGQLSAAVSAASDRLSARLAQVSAAMSPGWPAESAALGGVSRLPVEVAGGDDPVVSAALARQLVRGGYALAGLVVAVVAWQLAASLPGTVKGREAVRAPEDDAFEEPTTSKLNPATNTSSTPVVADPSSPAPNTAEAAAPQTPPQAQELPMIELGPDDVLPPELQGKNVAGRFCLRHPPLGPASHAHFSAGASPAAVAAAAATVEALRAEAAEMQRAAAAAGTTASESDRPLHHLTVQEAAGKGEEVMQAALAAAAAASAAAAAASEPQQQQEAVLPAVSVEFTPLQAPATDGVDDDDDQPLFRVELKVSEEEQAAHNDTAAAADSIEGRLAAEVVREALVAESCAAAAAAAAERAQIASHLIEDAIAAAHSSPRGNQASQTADQPAADHHSSAGFSSSSSQEVGHVEPGTIDVSWDEVSCSLAAEVLAAEAPTAAVTEALDAAAATPQEVPVTWQQPPAAADDDSEVQQAETEAPATETTAEAAAEPAPAAAVGKKQEIPITWQQPTAAMTVAVQPLDAAAPTQDLPISWQQPAAEVVEGSVQELVEEAKGAEAAAEQAEAARAAAAAAVARVAAAKAARAAAAAAVARVAAAKAAGGDEQQTAPATPDDSTGASATTADQQEQEQDMQELIDEAKAAEAAAEEAETARAVAAAAVARVAALKVAQASTPSPQLPQDLPAEAADGAAAAVLIEEAKVAEAAALEAEAARTAAAAAVARVAASKAALANAAAAAVAEAADSQASVDADTDAARSAAAAAVSRVAATRAAQAELIAEAIAAEAAAIAAEAAADAAGSAAAAEASAGDAAERVKAQLSSTTCSSSAGEDSTTQSPVTVSWVLAGDDSEALAQLTHLAAGLGHPAIGPISSSSSSSDIEVTADDSGAAAAAVGGEEEASAAVEQLLQAEETEEAVLLLAHLSKINAALEAACSEQDTTVPAVDDADADAFKDEFGVPDIDLVTQLSVLPKGPVAARPAEADAAAAAAGSSEGLRPQPSLLEVLDAASRQQMQAASETALQQAQARVVQLYRARKAAQRTTALQQTAAASGGPRVDEPHTKRNTAAAAAASRLGRPSGLSPLQQQLASQLGVNDVALALALAGLSPRGDRSKGGQAQAPADTTAAAAEAAAAKKPQASTADVTVVRNSCDPYSSTALVLSKDSSTGQLGSNNHVDIVAVTAAGINPGAFDVPVQKPEAVEPADTTASKLAAASPAEPKAGSSSSGQATAGRKQIEVRWVDKVEDEAESFEVAVQHMIINTAVKYARARSQSSAAMKAFSARAAAATRKVEAAAAAASKSGSSSDAASPTNAATEGCMEVEVARPDRSVDSFEVAVQRMVSGATPKANNASKRPSKAAAPRPNSRNSSSSSGAASNTTSSKASSGTSHAASSSSKGAVRIEIKHPDRTADSFDVAVQQMVQSTANRSDNNNDSKEDAASSSQSKKSSSGPGKGFGKAVYINPSRQPQARSRSPPVVGSNVVPMYTNRAPINSSSLRPVPWWLQRSAARRTSSNGSDWDGFKPRPGAPVAAAAAPVQLPADATPAASAAAAPTSIPVEWLETPTARKRVELQERAAAILKQQDGPGSSPTPAQTDKKAPIVAGGSSTTSTTQQRELPAGWGVVKVGGASMQQQGALKPLSWSAVSTQLMNELEAELSASLDPPAKPLADPTAELTAPYATPQVPSATAAPGRSGRRSPGRKGRLPQGRQGPQGSKAGSDQAASNGKGGSA